MRDIKRIEWFKSKIKTPDDWYLYFVWLYASEGEEYTEEELEDIKQDAIRCFAVHRELMAFWEENADLRLQQVCIACGWIKLKPGFWFYKEDQDYINTFNK